MEIYQVIPPTITTSKCFRKISSTSARFGWLFQGTPREPQEGVWLQRAGQRRPGGPRHLVEERQARLFQGKMMVHSVKVISDVVKFPIIFTISDFNCSTKANFQNFSFIKRPTLNTWAARPKTIPPARWRRWWRTWWRVGSLKPATRWTSVWFYSSNLGIVNSDSTKEWNLIRNTKN